MKTTLVILEGDQTGQELLEEALRIIDPSIINIDLELIHFDLSLKNRQLTENRVVFEAATAIREYGLGLKAATITPSGKGDVGSPNRILREEIGAEVILRTGRRIPGVRPIAGVYAPISVVRMAIEDAYGAKEWREGEKGSLAEVAYRTEKITRRVCRAVAEYAFQHAKYTKARVFGGPKFTVSPVYEGMFKEELDAAAERYPDVRYEPQLIDATFALLLATTGESLVIPSLNRDGDQGHVACVMAEAPHGTAPTLEGKNVANPMAMILATAGLLTHVGNQTADNASRAIYEATLEAGYDGVLTADLGGIVKTDEFTSEVIRRVTSKLEVWATLA